METIIRNGSTRNQVHDQINLGTNKSCVVGYG
jgi:hypothetical protein